MFDLLKKKLSGFINSITNKEEAKAEQSPRVEVEQVKPAPQPPQHAPAEQPLSPSLEKTEPEEFAVEKEEREVSELVGEKVTQIPVPRHEKPRHEKHAREEPEKEKTPFAEPEVRHVVVQEEHEIEPTTKLLRKKEERELTAKIGIVSQIKSFFTQKITITESDVQDLLEELELALLESDVSYGTSQFLISQLRKRLVGKTVEKNQLKQAIKEEVAASLIETLTPVHTGFDFWNAMSAKQRTGAPFIVMFVGPNGAGKTTTIAKVAFFLKNKKHSCVIAAADTFRAAAIEQIIEHANKLEIPIIKHTYGADPAAVAFDALAHARANNIEVVLIDTAGRQETSYNLVKEMEKINRVVKPDAKIFIGEATSGSALVEQIKRFDQAISLDGIILTKLDADAKGGNALSIAHEAGLPVLFIGTGQEYEDLEPFQPKDIVEKILEQ
ncbi:MAG TPA: signal recognition particle-docking protein FtsY [Candidatus Norongarragalinales archaeon]|jgi:fused signal recognition particle receptor|nr:signal recognition particle-docking protein FtsY [Candidatus Norongarragalinales archaeon]